MPQRCRLRAGSCADGQGMPSRVRCSAIAYSPCPARNSARIRATTGIASGSVSSLCSRLPSAALAGLGCGPASAIRYGSCRSLFGQRIGVGVPAPAGLPGAVLVAAAPQGPAVAVGPVAAGLGDDGAAELPEQLGDGDGDQAEDGGVAVTGALPGGCGGEESAAGQADRSPAVPGGPGGDLAAVQPAGLLGLLVV